MYLQAAKVMTLRARIQREPPDDERVHEVLFSPHATGTILSQRKRTMGALNALRCGRMLRRMRVRLGCSFPQDCVRTQAMAAV